jgi:hypothetical protein
MKIRSGFVSNSSSTSFVIGYKESVPCPHCGRKDPDIIALIERNSSYASDDTRVERQGPDFVELLEENIREIENRINDLKRRDPEEITYSSGTYTCKVKNDIEYAQKNLEEAKDLLKLVEDAVKNQFNVADIAISYHDSEMREIFFAAEKNGTIVILKKSE